MDRLSQSITNILGNAALPKELKERFEEKLKAGKLTIQEDEFDHYCIYFAAIDPEAQQVFIGHHKKSGLWLFNGGHIDAGETPEETIVREIGEEWGLDAGDLVISDPALLTVTDIIVNMVRPCRTHFDIWHFIGVRQSDFHPKPECLAEEFHETGWKDISEARELITEKNTLKSLDFIEQNYFC